MGPPPIPGGRLRRLVELVAAVGAKPDSRDEVRRGVEDAMAGHLIRELNPFDCPPLF
jgi:hypothetical protein